MSAPFFSLLFELKKVSVLGLGHSDILRHSHIFSGEETWFRTIFASQSIESWRRSLFQIRQKLPSAQSLGLPSGYDIHRASHGEAMALIEIDGLPFSIA